MKHLGFAVIVVLLFLEATSFVEAGNFTYRYYRDHHRCIAMVPDRLGDIDTTRLTFEVISRKGVSNYTVTELTQFTVNGQPAKFDDLKKGMRVSIVGDGKAVSRVDAKDCFAGPKK